MIPYLFQDGTTSFIGSGLGIFDKAVSCKVVEQLNAQFELQMEILQEDRLFPSLKIGTIIMAKPNVTDDIQPFIVENIEKSINGIITIYATHIAQYRSKLIPIAPFKAISLADAIDKIYLNSLETNIFNFTTNKTSLAPISYDIPKTFRSILGGEEGSILDVYGGEYLYDKLDIYLLDKRGRTDGKIKVMFGKNMVEYLENDYFDWDKSITGVLPYYNRDTYIQGDIQYSTNVDFYKYKKTIPLDVSDKFEDVVPTKAQVNAEGVSYLLRCGLPSVSIKAAFDDVYSLPMFENLKEQFRILKLGDVVEVINSQFNTQYTTRIQETDYNVLGDFYNSVTIGDVSGTINDAIRNTVQIDTNSHGPTLIWENTSKSNFSAQTISIDLSSYQFVLMCFSYTADAPTNSNTTMICFADGNSYRMTSGNARKDFRDATVNADSIVFGAGRKVQTYNQTNQTVNDNSLVIPRKIYGFR